MRTVAVYPGRFHPFSLGHQGVYDQLSNDPKFDEVYILTSAKQNNTDSPFTFADKVAMMTKTGIPSGHIVQVKNPYKINEIVELLGLDPEQDRLVYALGSDDASRFDYTPVSPLQRYNSKKKMQPVGKHAYVKIIPQIPYNILGKKLTHASDIRKMYLNGNDNDRMQIITDLYGRADPELKAMFDQRLAVDTTLAGQQDRVKKLQENIQFLRKQLSVLREKQDYVNEKKH